MSAIARTCLIVSVILFVSGVGCNEPPAPFKTVDRTPKADRDAPFDPPQTYPEWAYDSEKYMRPVEDLKPEPRVRPTDPLHYFTNKRTVMVRQPSGYTPEEIPRIAVWWTDDNGFHWQKAGYFGRQESYFPFEARDDGDYGIRFVGPGQAPAQPVGPEPERVYHVDTALPEVEVRIEPEQTWYHVGETVNISWRAGDAHLIANAVKLGVLPDFSAAKREMAELQRDLSDEGTISYKIPAEALDQELRIRVDALDRAGNLGTAVSHALQVVEAGVSDKEVKEEKASAEEQEKGADSQSTDQLAEHSEPVSKATETPDDEATELVAEASGTGADGNSDLFGSREPFFADAASTENETAPVGAARPAQGSDRAAIEDGSRGAAGPTFAEAEAARPEPAWEGVSVVDPTHGNGLLVPFPATVESQTMQTRNVLVTAHPWRVLGLVMPAPLRTVWALPEPRQGMKLYRKIEARFLADHRGLRPAGEAGGVNWSFAGGALSNPSEPQEIAEP